MSVSNFMIQTSKLSLLKLPNSSDQSFSSTSPYCQLQWRANKLWVKRAERVKTGSPTLPALESEQWLRVCLEHSPIDAVCLDPALGEAAIQAWADACEQAGKSVFLRVPPIPGLPKQRKPYIWKIKRIVDWVLAALILLILSPVLLVLATLIRWSTSQSFLTKEWAVGRQGQLFRLYRFNVSNSEQKLPDLKHWMQKCGLEKLPQFIHVIRGQMSLVGPHAFSLSEAEQVDPTCLHRLKVLPGITGAKQLMSKFSFPSSHPAQQPEFQYLESWTLTRDFQFLLLAIPKALLGFSPY